MEKLCKNKYPLKEIKLSLRREYNKNLSFLSYDEDTLEVFEIEYDNINQDIKYIIPILNKIKNLKKIENNRKYNTFSIIRIKKYSKS